MHALDWIVLIGSTLLIILYGVWKTRRNTTMDSYLLAGHSTHWWTIGLSVMATQASAITFLSTPGQAFSDGMGFVQFYFGLPIAMVIICMVFIPRYYGMKVFTVYEFLEKRFDVRTRLLTAFLFLIQRGLGASITIFAPSIILSSILGWNLNLTIVVIGIVVTAYTAFGGTQAVSASHKLQMAVMMGGIITAFIITLQSLPEGISFIDALRIAGASDKLQIVNFNLDLDNRYTFWSGITGGTFLALAYFGTDQSQAQRYITGHSIRDSRLGLLFNAVFKIPMQFFILLAGVMVFVFYQFMPSPVFFNSSAEKEIMQTSAAPAYAQLQADWNQEQKEREKLYTPLIQDGTAVTDQKRLEESFTKEKEWREEARALVEKNTPQMESNDRDYIFIRFILDYLPTGIIGLLLTSILAAGMSSTASELNALASTSTMDFYKRLWRKDSSETHYVNVSKSMTVLWGLIAIGFASYGSLFENLIQFVNIIGSIFYGTILGVFLSAFLIRRMTAVAVFVGALVAQGIVLALYFTSSIGFLWYNVIGCGAVILMGLLLSPILAMKRKEPEQS